MPRGERKRRKEVLQWNIKCNNCMLLTFKNAPTFGI